MPTRPPCPPSLRAEIVSALAATLAAAWRREQQAADDDGPPAVAREAGREGVGAPDDDRITPET